MRLLLVMWIMIVNTKSISKYILQFSLNMHFYSFHLTCIGNLCWWNVIVHTIMVIYWKIIGKWIHEKSWNSQTKSNQKPITYTKYNMKYHYHRKLVLISMIMVPYRIIIIVIIIISKKHPYQALSVALGFRICLSIFWLLIICD